MIKAIKDYIYMAKNHKRLEVKFKGKVSSDPSYHAYGYHQYKVLEKAYIRGYTIGYRGRVSIVHGFSRFLPLAKTLYPSKVNHEALGRDIYKYFAAGYEEAYDDKRKLSAFEG